MAYGDRKSGLFGAPLLPTFSSAATPPANSMSFAPAPDDGSSMDSGHPLALPTYHPSRRNLSQNLGLLADAFRGSHDNGDRYDQLDQRNYNTWLSQAQQQLQRAAQFSQFKNEYDYKLANPTPPNNDTVNDYKFILSTLGKDRADEYLRNVAAGQPIPIRNADGTYNVLSRSQLQTGGAPTAPVGKLTPIPSAATDGEAGTILGGAAASNTISAEQAAQIRSSLGPNGQGAFNNWLAQHNIRIAN